MLLSYTHITLGLLLPAALAAATEVRLFRLDEHQRRQLGVPPEGGWRGWMLGALEGLGELDWLTWVVATWVLLGCLFNGALLASGARLRAATPA